MDEQKYICPSCGGLVDYGSKFCPHCRYEFGEWAAQADANQNSLPSGDSVDNGNTSRKIKRQKHRHFL